jgi:hypothetical protein
VRLYTVDRRGVCSTGAVISLTKFDDITPPYLQRHVDESFPDGVSRHGNQYFLGDTSVATAASPNIELLWEYVRRANFPAGPSRFTSMFGCASEADARTFAALHGAGTIWEVDLSNAFRADMSWLHLNGSILEVSYAANAYWRQEPVTSVRPATPSFWEYLMPLPLTVGAQIG